MVRRDGDITVVAGDREFRAAQLLVATGRAPRTADLGLEAVGVETGGRGEVVVGDDLSLSTTNPRVWAVGDVTGHPQFVHVAARHGALVVDNAFGRAARRVDYDALPRITFTIPTLASAGLTEAQAVQRGVRCESRVLGLEHVPRAIISRDTRGLVKLVPEHDSGWVVGVHLLADGAGDAILAGVYAIEGAMTVAQLASSWYPYLTIGQAIWLAAQSFTRDPGDAVVLRDVTSELRRQSCARDVPVAASESPSARRPPTVRVRLVSIRRQLGQKRVWCVTASACSVSRSPSR